MAVTVPPWAFQIAGRGKEQVPKRHFLSDCKKFLSAEKHTLFPRMPHKRCTDGQTFFAMFHATRHALSSARPKTTASRSHTDSIRVERVDRAESVALLDAKRPYSTLMFSRKERKGRKERSPWDADPDLITTSCQIMRLPVQNHNRQMGLSPQFPNTAPTIYLIFRHGSATTK